MLADAQILILARAAIIMAMELRLGYGIDAGVQGVQIGALLL